MDSDSELESKNLDSDSRKKGGFGFESGFEISGSDHTPTIFHGQLDSNPDLKQLPIGSFSPVQGELDSDSDSRKKGWIQIQLDSDSRCLDSDLRCLDSHITAMNHSTHIHFAQGIILVPDKGKHHFLINKLITLSVIIR